MKLHKMRCNNTVFYIYILDNIVPKLRLIFQYCTINIAPNQRCTRKFTSISEQFSQVNIKTTLQHFIIMGFYASKNMYLPFFEKRPKWTLFIALQFHANLFFNVKTKFHGNIRNVYTFQIAGKCRTVLTHTKVNIYKSSLTTETRQMTNLHSFQVEGSFLFIYVLSANTLICILTYT